MAIAINQAFRSLAAGIAVYALVAACSGEGSVGAASAQPAPNGGEAGAVALGGASSAPEEGGAAGAAGAGGAMPARPWVVEADCNIPATDGSSAAYAEAAFPGVSVEELASVDALLEFPPSIWTVPHGAYGDIEIPPGYWRQAVQPWVQAGKVAVYCGVPGTGYYSAKVKFILR